MKKENVLRIIFWFLVGMAFTSMIMLIIMGNPIVFDYFIIGLLGCNILVKVIMYIIARVSYYKTYIKYKKIFAYLKYIHKTRYQHYLKGDMEEVKRYQELVHYNTINNG